MPLGNSKKVFSQASFVLPNVSISTHPSAPQRTPKIAIRMMGSQLVPLGSLHPRIFNALKNALQAVRAFFFHLSTSTSCGFCSVFYHLLKI
jgi:hypothetical protein